MTPRLQLDIRDVFGRNVRAFRLARGLTQEDLARRAKVRRAYLSQIEHGVSHASLRLVSAFALALDVQPAELFKPPSNGDKAVDLRVQKHSGKSRSRRKA